MYLAKFLAHAGVCSRRKAAEIVKQGLVKVDDKTQINPAFLVEDQHKVSFQGKQVRLQENKAYYLFNKPKGLLTSLVDPDGRRTIMDYLWHKGLKEKVYPVGRLDVNTTGLLLLTNDGDLAHKLTHPKFEVSKTYQVKLHRELDKKDEDRIKKGFLLPDGFIRADKLRVSPQDAREVELTLHSGRNRIVRRIFEHFGYKVSRLHRSRVGKLAIKGVPIGEWKRVNSLRP